MSRHIRNRDFAPVFQPVSTYTVAPDHYADPEQNEKWPYHDTGREFRLNSIPYKAGDVIWMEHHGEPRKAYISYALYERAHDGFLREKYKVHIANKKRDTFAKNWFYTWAGFIERGYQLAAKTAAIA